MWPASLIIKTLIWQNNGELELTITTSSQGTGTGADPPVKKDSMGHILPLTLRQKALSSSHCVFTSGDLEDFKHLMHQCICIQECLCLLRPAMLALWLSVLSSCFYALFY